MASGLFCLPMEYNLEQTANFNIDFNDTTADRFKCMLTTSSWTPNYSTHSIKSDVTNEVSGTGYSAGGESLTSITFATSGGTITWDAADVEWGEFRWGVGGGLRYDTPAGPFRVEYGHKLQRLEGESAGEFNFSFGVVF